MASSPVAGVALSGRFKGLGLENAYRLSQSARKGVKPDLFYSFAKAINMPEKTLAGIINLSARTLSNYKEQGKTLEPVYSEHLLKLISLFDKGETVFGTIPEVNYWLQKPFWNVKEKPQDWLVTPGGVDLLIKELGKIAQGYPL